MFPNDKAKLRAGRLAYFERYAILDELGKEAQRRYDRILTMNPRGYNLGFLRGSLKYTPNMFTFDNEYSIEAQNLELTKIAYYFEYGTGLYNTRRRSANRQRITPVMKDALSFVSNGKRVFAKEVKGVKPVYMMFKATKSVEHDRLHLQRKIRLRLGI